MRNVSKQEIDSASIPQLKQLCEEIRSEIFCTVSSCGGHLSSNLGVVDLTVALHRIFDFPHDKIAYPAFRNAMKAFTIVMIRVMPERRCPLRLESPKHGISNTKILKSLH